MTAASLGSPQNNTRPSFLDKSSYIFGNNKPLNEIKTIKPEYKAVKLKKKTLQTSDIHSIMS